MTVNLEVKFNQLPDSSGYGSSLVNWYNKVIKKPLENLDTGDLSRIIRQKGLFNQEARNFVLNQAGICLLENPFCGELYTGELLRAVSELSEQELMNLPEKNKLISVLEATKLNYQSVFTEQDGEFVWVDEKGAEDFLSNLDLLLLKIKNIDKEKADDENGKKLRD